MLECGYQLGVSQLCTNLSLKFLFVIIIVPVFFCGQDNLLGGQFWAVGRFNLLGGQMPTQLTCYLPLCLVLVDKDAHQRETITKWPIWLALKQIVQ